jgi:tRNA dimethylallyltransferase
MASGRPLIAIVGETASGKSALALELAQQFDGEIIAADSRTIYKGLDIGSAKPSKEELARVPHYGIDVVSPGQSFTVHDFQQLAYAAIEDIRTRGKVPIMVGGTGLYIDSVLYDYDFSPRANEANRQELQSLDVKELQARLGAEDIPLPENYQNPRHLIRQLETKGARVTPKDLRADTLVLGLQIEREVLRERVRKRVDVMIEHGLVNEVHQVADQYGWECEPMKGIGYREFSAYFAELESLEETKARIVADTMQLAKRQRTWFKRNKSIHWVREQTEAVAYTTTFLNKYPL